MKPTVIIMIPARYASKRFPGKPFAEVQPNETMLQRIIRIAQQAQQTLLADIAADIIVGVTSENNDILEHARQQGISLTINVNHANSGTERIFLALQQEQLQADYIINLQGDAVMTPSILLVTLIKELLQAKSPVCTPAIKLTWEALQRLQTAKMTQPFSGTSVVIDKQNNALWFSKAILPLIRDREAMTRQKLLSPVYQHIGLYGYSYMALQKFMHLAPGVYEELEGLEQLRFLENNIPLKVLKFRLVNAIDWRNVDCVADLAVVEEYLQAKTTVELTPLE